MNLDEFRTGKEASENSVKFCLAATLVFAVLGILFGGSK